MNIFKMLCRTLVLSAVAVALSVGVTGCPGNTGDNPVKPDNNSSNTFTDSRDGKTYRTVKIGNQTWMAENLNYVTDSSWCSGGTPDGCAKYGRGYTWYAAAGVCPRGWHLPDRDEWDRLARSVGGTEDGSRGMREWHNAGIELKSTSGWDRNGNGTNSSGFSAMPGGNRSTDGEFTHVGDNGNWWTAVESNDGDAYFRFMDDDKDKLGEWPYPTGWGFSVRCVKDE